MKKRFLLLFVFLGLLISSLAQAQVATKKKVDELTDEEVTLFFQKAQSSGMTEAQIETAAKAQGYTAADIAKMRERLGKVGTNPNTKALDNTMSMERMINGQDELSQKVDQAENIKDLKTPKEPQVKNDYFIEKSSKKTVYGENLFNNKKLSFEPNLKIATPKNYQLGPDDELNIDIFGDVLDNFKVRVSPEGTIKILNLGPIYVNGMSIELASERIVSRLRQLYQGLNKPGSGSSAQVTLGNVRSMKVTLTGEVKNPGTYTVSSLATVFNALYLAGGPNENGSYRNIRVIRGNKLIRTLDLYDFLLRADQKDNIHLQDQDVIRIGDYETRVEFVGEVKRPMVFEAVKGETIKDLLRYAGGFTDKAYTYTFSARRNTSRELKLVNVTQDEVATFLPQNGDLYTIGTIINRYENRVEVEGAVFRPGIYAMEAGLTTVKELIKKAEGTKENAFLNRATLTRRKENYDPEMISLDLGKILRGEAPDVALHREDILKVYGLDDIKEKFMVNIVGEVNEPGEFDYREGMRVGDLILMAKGLKVSASYAKLELARRIISHGAGEPGDAKVLIKTFEIDGNLQLGNEGSQLVLQPFDILSIRRAPNYEEQRSVKINGQVNYPGSYAIQDQKQKISDLISMAGGLKEESYLEGAKLFRDSTTVGVDLNLILDDPNREENILLVAGDRLEIPRQLQTVKLTGAVQNPLALSFKSGASLRDYISGAGGYLDEADKSRAYVKYANGVSVQIKQFLFFHKYPAIKPGSEIVVPEIPKDRKKGLSTGEAIGLTTSLASLSLTLITLINNLTK